LRELSLIKAGHLEWVEKPDPVLAEAHHHGRPAARPPRPQVKERLHVRREALDQFVLAVGSNLEEALRSGIAKLSETD
jgi:hypothetical protein